MANVWQPTETQQAANDPESGIELEVDVTKPVRTITNPFTEVTVTTSKSITLQPNNRVQLKELGMLDSRHVYILQIANLAVGDTPFNLKVNDKQGNEKDIQLTITRDIFSFPVGLREVGGWPDAKYVLDGNDLKVKVDKTSRLLEDYEPNDLLDLNKDLGLYTLNNAQLRAEAGRQLKAMLDALSKATGKYVTVASGYRSYETQVRTYAGWVRELGVKGADKVSAKPGHSEHQLGTTIDFVNDETKWQISDQFGKTTAGKWLAVNCKKYGFILPYTTDNSNTGGYKEESWHFRYVGFPEDSTQ